MRRTDSDMAAFSETINNLRLVDIDIKNEIYSGNNRRGGVNQIASLLDKFVIS